MKALYLRYCFGKIIEACKLSSRLSDCRVFSLCENVAVSHALLLTEFL